MPEFSYMKLLLLLILTIVLTSVIYSQAFGYRQTISVETESKAHGRNSQSDTSKFTISPSTIDWFIMRIRSAGLSTVGQDADEPRGLWSGIPYIIQKQM